MHYKQLLNITSRHESDGVYERTIQNLEWHSPQFGIKKAVPIFESFLGAWHSLRRPLGKEEMVRIWTKDVEPYAMALQGKFLENLDVDKFVEIKREKLRIGVAIEHMYGALGTIPGVGDTNASKLLHLRLPGLFVMTDGDIRSMFKGVRDEKFSPYSYAFNFLPFMKSHVNDAIDTLRAEKRLSRQQAMKFLRNSHNRNRSLAKLMDECYVTAAHKLNEFPEAYRIFGDVGAQYEK